MFQKRTFVEFAAVSLCAGAIAFALALAGGGVINDSYTALSQVVSQLASR